MSTPTPGDFYLDGQQKSLERFRQELQMIAGACKALTANEAIAKAIEWLDLRVDAIKKTRTRVRDL